MTTKSPATELTPLLTAMLNMTAFHREHEKFYSTAPRERAVVLQRHARTLHGLADRWTTTLREHTEHWAAVYPMTWRRAS